MKDFEANIFLKKGEKKDFVKAQEQYNINVYLQENSQLRFYTFNCGENSATNNLNVTFQGKGARAELYGLYLPLSDCIIENNTFLRHKAAFCQSFQQYYGILPEGGKAIFNGRILVERGAQKTDAYLESKNILLGESSKMFGKPFLEIFADDVKCTHGFASYKIDENEIFYLQGRGIKKEKAEKILLLAFARRIINNVDSKHSQNYLENLVKENLNYEF